MGQQGVRVPGSPSVGTPDNTLFAGGIAGVLAGAVNAFGTLGGGLTQAISFVGQIAGSASLTGALSQAIALVGSVPSTAALSGALTSGALAGGTFDNSDANQSGFIFFEGWY